MDEDASFTLRLVDEISAAARAMKDASGGVEDALGEAGKAAEEAGAALKDTSKEVDKTTAAMLRLDQAMAHQEWVKLKRGQTEASKLSSEFKKMDDAMAHQKWVGLKRAEVQSQKAAFASQKAAVSAQLHADGLKRVEALGPRLDETVKGPMLSIAKAGALAVAAVGAVAAVAVFKFGEASIHMTSFAQKSTLALTQLTGSAATAAVEFDEVRKMSGRFGLDVEATQKSFQKLLASQFSVSMSKDLIKMGADLQVVTGEAESAQRALLTISQIKSKGKLQGEELMQLQEAGVSQGLILDALEHALGKDRAQVQKMLSAGQIDSDTGVGAIIEAIKHKVGEHELGEAGAKFADTTLAGFQGRMKAGLQNAMIDIGTRIEPGVVRITQLIQGSIDKLAKSGKLEALGDALVRGFDRFTSFIESNWPAIEAAVVFTIDAIIGGVNMAVAALQFMSDHWSTIKTVLGGVAAVLGVMAVSAVVMFAPFLLLGAAIVAAGVAIFWLIGKVIPLAIAVFQSWWEVIKGIFAPFVEAFAKIGAIFDDAGMSWTAKIFAIGVAIMEGLAKGMLAMLTAPLDLVWSIGKKIVGAFESVMKIGSPAKVMEPPGQFTVEGIVVGMDKAADGAVREVKGIGSEMTDVFTGEVMFKTPSLLPSVPATGAATEPAPTVQGSTAEAASAAVRGVQAPEDSGPSGGTTTGDIHIDVHVNGAGESGEQLGSTIGIAIRRELVALFEKA